MKKHPIIPLLLLAAVGALVSSPSAAMCIDPGPPRLLEAEVVGCENPRAAAEKRFRESTEMHRLPGPALNEILVGRPAQLLTLRVIRTQQLSADPRSQEGVTRESWAAVEKPEEKQFLLLDAKGCDGLKAGSRQVFLEEFTCCDVLPPQDVACLLQVPTLVAPPEALGKADTH
jgi:hypothetical protein